MQFKLFLLVSTILCLNLLFQLVVSTSTEALLECGRVHHVDNIQNHSTATASYSNSQCMLLCGFGNTILPVDSIHEGRSCPDDSNGICRAGKCIGGQEDALRECGLKHGVDFHQVDNHQGTAFANDQCMLRCVLGGDQLSAAHLHEGSPCPANPNGVCRIGTCLTQSTYNGSTATPLPTIATQPSIGSFFPSKMKLLNITIESTDPSLNQTKEIYLFFRESTQTGFLSILYFYGNPTTPNHYYPLTINAIPSKLKKDSQLEIDLHESKILLTEQLVDLYPLFANFYHNHKLAFREHENFVSKFPIYRKASPHDKLMDVALRFTIVFSKN